jgi:ribosomal protein S18 acetylase RimI-like enzyme
VDFEVVTWHLELTDALELQPVRTTRADFEIRRAEHRVPELNRFFYTAVGGDWYWIDRLSWSYDQWRAWLERSELETWIAYLQHTPAGYFELEMQEQATVEIAYIGLLPEFVGHGLGGALLTRAIERGFAIGARRVWCHTCSLDHPAALSNYRARGMRVFRQEIVRKELPERSPGPWPGARGATREREQESTGRRRAASQAHS